VSGVIDTLESRYNNISAALNATVIFKSYVRQVRTWLRAVTVVRCRCSKLQTYEIRRCVVGRIVPDVSKNRSAFTFSVKRHINIPVRTSKPAMPLSSCKYAIPRITSGEGPMIIKRQVLKYVYVQLI